MPYIVKKEDPEKSGIGICENCENEASVRRVEAVDFITRKGRGWFNFCYECFGPRIFWRKTYKSPQVFESPIEVKA